MGYSGIRIYKTKDADLQITSKVGSKNPGQPEKTEAEISRERDLKLCYWLGLFIPIYGLMISAIIMKGDGVRSALKGAIEAFFLAFFFALIAIPIIAAIFFAEG